ncbi:MAG: UrcA family protein [Sandarakinorhabdus sp.]|nr:UrcA family protein [Sandarakinorhabdus sp.]
MKITTVIAAAAALVASTISVSAAIAAPASNEVRVSVAGINLGSPAGRAVLENRIKQAAEMACGVDKSDRQLAVIVETNGCYDAAVSKAHADVANLGRAVLASR